jgi:predicted amidohydrolase
VRRAESFSDLVHKLDDHLKGDGVVEPRRLLQACQRRCDARERQRSAVTGICEPGVAGTHTLGILDGSGKIKSSVREARARGVWMDIGHGFGSFVLSFSPSPPTTTRMFRVSCSAARHRLPRTHPTRSFNFESARQTLDAGFPPDSISTDIYNLNVRGPVYDLPTTMSKMLYLGMSFEEILQRTTFNPAKIINRVGMLGTLQVGAPADLALLAIEEGSFQLVDSQKNTVMAKQRIVSRLTICRGKRLFAL